MLSELTYKVVAYDYVSRLNSDEVIEWALDMLDLNFNAPSLYILASFERNTPFYELRAYLEKAIDELKLNRCKQENAIISYCSFYINQIANRKNVRENIETLCEIAIHEELPEELNDFYNLNFAWIDYEDDPNYPYNHYWEGATAKNISRICIEQAELWLKKYKDQYKQNTSNTP